MLWKLCNCDGCFSLIHCVSLFFFNAVYRGQKRHFEQIFGPSAAVRRVSRTSGECVGERQDSASSNIFGLYSQSFKWMQSAIIDVLVANCCESKASVLGFLGFRIHGLWCTHSWRLKGVMCELLHNVRRLTSKEKEGMQVVDGRFDIKSWEGGVQLLLFGIQRVVMSDALEKFFQGYQLAGHAFKHFHVWAVGDF